MRNYTFGIYYMLQHCLSVLSANVVTKSVWLLDSKHVALCKDSPEDEHIVFAKRAHRGKQF